MMRNFKLADFEATSSKSLIKHFEMGRLKLVEERNNYGRKLGDSHGKDEDMPMLDVVGGQKELGATQKLGNKGEAAGKRQKKSMPTMAATQTKGKEAEDARKRVKTHTPTVEAKDSQRTLAATQINKGNQGEAASTKLKKVVRTKLDFSHLRRALDAISNRNSAMSESLEEQQSIPTKQPENTRNNTMDTTAAIKKRRVFQGEPSAQCLHNSEPAKKDRTEIVRKLEEIRKGAA